MDNDLFTYKVEVANIPCNSVMDDDLEDETDDDMGYDPSDIRGDDKVELTDKESSEDEDEIAEVFRIDTNIFDYETPICSAFNEFNYLLKVDPDLLTKDIMGFKTYDDYKNDWIYEWNKDLPWVDKKPWTDTTGKKMVIVMEEIYLELTLLKTNSIIRITSDNGNKELCEIHKPTVCNIRKYVMIKYSFNDDEEYVVVKEDEYCDLIMTRRDACQAYQEIFRIMDEGWMLLEDIDDYRDNEMGDIIFGKPFLREVGIKTERFEGIITLYNGDNEVSEKDKINRISHAYQKLKGFYKEVLNLGPDFIRVPSMEEWLTRGHISVHELG
ncbi:hypothetical protein Tco_1264897 [Tanacetum coccineum]